MRKLALLTTLAGSVFFGWTAAAATHTVCSSSCEFTSIKTAIASGSVAAGDTLQLSAETYTESGISLSKNLTIVGAGQGLTIVQANASYATATMPTFTVPSGVTVNLRDFSVRNGCTSSLTYGGGVDSQGTLTVERMTFERNVAGYGAGIANRSGTLTVTRCNFFDNLGAYAGGGVYSNGGTTTIDQSTFSANVGAGAGLFVGLGLVVVTNSAIVSNSTSGGTIGGGVDVARNGEVRLTNCTITDNIVTGTTSGGGGALYVDGVAKLDHCTVANNHAYYAGGGVYVTSYGNVQLHNTILAANKADVFGDDCWGNVDSYGYVLVGSLSGCAVAQRSGGNIFGENPALDDLRNNGGQTVTRALLSSSPAINAGSCTDLNGATVTTDQRGTARPLLGGCDLGAYEYDGVAPVGRYQCWDNDINAVCDLATEDTNKDGSCTPSDCRGEDGLTCWDLNANRACDTSTEDLNHDSACDILDCRGATGQSGVACWDLNSNRICDPAEDKNLDLACNVLDCQGTAGSSGTNGYNCWDTDRDYICDPTEDVNSDAVCSPLDCRGATGSRGLAAGTRTPTGSAIRAAKIRTQTGCATR